MKASASIPGASPGIPLAICQAILGAWFTLASAPIPSAVAQDAPRPRYQLSATINTANGTVDVQESISFTNWTGVPLSAIVFRLPPAELGGVSLSRATSTNQAGDATLAAGVLEIPVQPPIQPAESARVDLAFTENVPRQAGRYGLTSEAITLGNWFATLSVHRGDWDRRPYTDVGDAFFTEVADFQVDVDTLRPMELAFTGVLTQRDGTRWSFLAENVRDVAIAGSPKYSIGRATVGGTNVTAYALVTSAQLLADSAAEILQWYAGRFGPYPYAELRAAETDLPASFGGMEYPGLIMLTTQYGSLNRGSQYEALVAHELAHQWFYALVGNDQIEAAWLDEGMATYAPVLFYQDVAPAMGQAQLQQIQSAPVIGPLNTSLYAFGGDSSYFTAIYRPAARLLHELRTAMGPETFDAALREYVAIHSHRIASPRALLDLLQRRTTANLDPIISRYVTYGAFSYPTPLQWTATLPSTTLSGSADLIIDAAFPVGQVDVWLDSQRLVSWDLGGARGGALPLDLRGSAPGEHVLQTRVFNNEGAQFEQETRVTVR